MNGCNWNIHTNNQRQPKRLQVRIQNVEPNATGGRSYGKNTFTGNPPHSKAQSAKANFYTNSLMYDENYDFDKTNSKK